MLSTLKFSSAVSSCCGGCCCYAIAGTAEGRAHKKTSTQQHNKRAASLGWGFAALANAPFGVSCCGGCCCYAIAGTAEGRAHKKTTTQQHNKRAASLGWGLRCRSPLAMRGRRAAAARTARTAEQPNSPNSPNSCRRFRPLPRPPSASVRFRRLPRPEAVYHSAVLSAAALLFFRRRRPPPAPFICGRWLGSICATDGHGIISPAAKIGFFRLRSLTFPPSLLEPGQLNTCPRLLFSSPAS